MSQLNANTPRIRCFVRNTYLNDLADTEGITPCEIFGVKSIMNTPLRFHILMDNGAMFWGLPISAFCWKQDFEPLTGEYVSNFDKESHRLATLSVWDAESNAIAITEFTYLRNKRVIYRDRYKQLHPGKYLFTIDNYTPDDNSINSGYANDYDAKCYHVIMLDNGNFATAPNNHLCVFNADFVKKEVWLDQQNLSMRPFQTELSSEDSKFTAGNSEEYFYKHQNYGK